jgi:hypothetical protein
MSEPNKTTNNALTKFEKGLHISSLAGKMHTTSHSGKVFPNMWHKNQV